MKTVKFLAMLMIGMAMSATMTSCSDDDDSSSSAMGSGNVDIEVKSGSLSYGYWLKESRSWGPSGKVWYNISLANFDMLRLGMVGDSEPDMSYARNLPSVLTACSISFYAPDSDELPTGTFTSNVDCDGDAAYYYMDEYRYSYQTEGHSSSQPTQKVTLVIEKEGSNYVISVNGKVYAEIDYEGENNTPDENLGIKNFTLTYKGRLQYVVERDDD